MVMSGKREEVGRGKNGCWEKSGCPFVSGAEFPVKSNLCSPQELRVLFFGPAALDLEPAALGLEVSPLLDGVGVVRGGRVGLTKHVGEEPVGSRIPAIWRGRLVIMRDWVARLEDWRRRGRKRDGYGAGGAPRVVPCIGIAVQHAELDVIQRELVVGLGLGQVRPQVRLLFGEREKHFVSKSGTTGAG